MPLSRLQNIYTPLLHVTITKRVVEFGERSVPSHNIYTGCGRRKGKERISQVRTAVQVIFPWHLVVVMKVCVNVYLFLQKGIN